MFNSSERRFEIYHGYLRVEDFTLEPNKVAHIVMTHPKSVCPEFTINRVAGKVECEGCDTFSQDLVQPYSILDPESGELVPQTLNKTTPNITVTTPGAYYLSSKQKPWMNDPCLPVIVEVIIADA